MKKSIITVFLLLASVFSTSVEAASANGFNYENGKYYWYENGVKQGVSGDPKNIRDTKFGMERGREIYDPYSDAWYWLDASEGGARAQGKEVWMPYIYQHDLKTGANSDGKWIRYDEYGRMIKGWLTIKGTLATTYPTQSGNTYYYDLKTGAMQKGWQEIDGYYYYFNESSGALVTDESKIPANMEFRLENGKWYWYEHGKKQGVKGDPLNIWDTVQHIERGREIYDPATNAWYWLDAQNGGARAQSKEVWMPYVFASETKGSTNGKWVRFDANGKMIHGWFNNSNGTYYYDLTSGAMFKGWNRIDGQDYHFNETTGILIVEVPQKTDPKPSTPVVTNVYCYSINSDVFHRLNCPSARKIKSSNYREVHATRDEMIAWGFRPCHNCNP